LLEGRDEQETERFLDLVKKLSIDDDVFADVSQSNLGSPDRAA
jgi:hypothetical protein